MSDQVPTRSDREHQTTWATWEPQRIASYGYASLCEMTEKDLKKARKREKRRKAVGFRKDAA